MKGISTPPVPKNAIVKGWVNFNGSAFGVRDSFNVSSVVDNGVGDYTVNWDTDFANADYAAVGTTSTYHVTCVNYLAGSVDVNVFNSANTQTDTVTISVGAFGEQ